MKVERTIRIALTIMFTTGSLAWASGSPASTHGEDLYQSSRPALTLRPVAPERRWERTELTDESTGADLRLTATKAGAYQVALSWTDLEFKKVQQRSGDYHVRIRAGQDLLVLIKTGQQLRLTRDGKSAVLKLQEADEAALDAAQVVLAGSRAVRTFRNIHVRLTDEARESAPGMALEAVDILLGLLQGDTSILTKQRTRRSAQLIRTSADDGPGCFQAYADEVCAAWDDFGQCCYEVRYMPGMQQVCCFVWLLRIESAWFQFMGCSSVPIKVE